MLLVVFNLFLVCNVNGANVPHHYELLSGKTHEVTDTIRRKGLFIGMGLGASHTTRKFSTNSYGINEKYADSNIGVTLEFKIGFSIRERVLVYYRERSIISSDYHFGNGKDEMFITTLAAIGVSYYIKKNVPSLYLNSSFGYALSNFLTSYRTPENHGVGYGVGIGYSFPKKINLELNYESMNLKPREYSQVPEHKRTSISVTLLYSFFIH